METASASPRALKDPVGSRPSSLTRTSSAPSLAAILGGRPPERRVVFLAADDQLNYEGVLRIVDLAKSGVEDLKIEFITTN